MKELTFLKVLMLIRHVHLKSVLFATNGIFCIKDLSFNQLSQSFFLSKKMIKEITTFDNTEIEKRKFHYSKYPIKINIADIDKIILSKKVSFRKKGFKYFIVYNDDEKVKPICIMLPKITRYVQSFDESKYISFLIKDNELIEKYNNILDKVAIILKKDLIVNQYTIKNT